MLRQEAGGEVRPLAHTTIGPDVTIRRQLGVAVAHLGERQIERIGMCPPENSSGSRTSTTNASVPSEILPVGHRHVPVQHVKALVYHGSGKRAWVEKPGSTIQTTTDPIVCVATSTAASTRLLLAVDPDVVNLLAARGDALRRNGHRLAIP